MKHLKQYGPLLSLTQNSHFFTLKNKTEVGLGKYINNEISKCSKYHLQCVFPSLTRAEKLLILMGGMTVE